MDTRIARALDYIDQRLDGHLTIETLSAAADLSPSRFAHLFRREVGTSPAQYVHALRMLRARVLLERSLLSVKEVMALVGCHDPSHFSRDFRLFHGLSPRQSRFGDRQDPHDLGSPAVGSQTGAAIAQIVALANQRRTRARKPRPRARAPDVARRCDTTHETRNICHHGV
jgi:AraC-like DNA-binding protein